METEKSEFGAAKAEYDLCYVDLRLRYEFYVRRTETVMVLTVEHCPKFQTEKVGTADLQEGPVYEVLKLF